MSQERRTDAGEGQGADQAEKIAQMAAQLAEWEKFRAYQMVRQESARYMFDRTADLRDHEACMFWLRKLDEVKQLLAKMPPPL